MPELVCTADDRDAWLAARQSGVTATDIAVILGLSSYNSPYSLFWQKMGQVPPQPDSDQLRLGRELEPAVMRRWREASGIPYSKFGGLYRSTARPWQMATPDRLTEAGDPVEAKTWADADRDSWGPSGPYSGPPAVRAQVLWQMDVMDAAVGHVGVLFLPSGEFRHYVIEHAEHTSPMSVCDVHADIEAMRVAGEEFMARLRMDLPPPDPDDSSAATLAAVRARFAKAEGKRGQVDEDTWDLWIGAKALVNKWQEAARDLEIQLREQLGEADEIEVDGQLVGRRVVFDQPKPAYTLHKDYIRRVKAGHDD